MKVINNLEFELYYSSNYCASFKSLDKAIKTAIDNYKNNEDMAERAEYYYIKLGFSVIVNIKCVNGNIVLE